MLTKPILCQHFCSVNNNNNNDNNNNGYILYCYFQTVSPSLTIQIIDKNN